jgi:hypothetical protein
VGAKGVLQSAWFCVTKIPADQRSVKTLAKVGGLVGKVLQIDEGSRFRYDYVRLKIVCRDVTKVPRTAKGTLGMYLIDFGFERELFEGNGEKVLKSGIKVGDDNQHLNKKSKTDVISGNQHKGSGARSTELSLENKESRKDHGKQQVYWSTPPNIDSKRKSQTKFMADAQKAYKELGDEEKGEKVHIPDTKTQIVTLL